jgi:hypothetical protein
VQCGRVLPCPRTRMLVWFGCWLDARTLVQRRTFWQTWLRQGVFPLHSLCVPLMARAVGSCSWRGNTLFASFPPPFPTHTRTSPWTTFPRLTPEPALLEYVKRMRTSDGFDYHDPRHVPSHVAGPVGDMEEEDRDGVDEDSAANVDSLPAEVGVDGPSEPVWSPLLTQGPGSGVPIPPPSRRPVSPSS